MTKNVRKESSRQCATVEVEVVLPDDYETDIWSVYEQVERQVHLWGTVTPELDRLNRERFLHHLKEVRQNQSKGRTTSYCADYLVMRVEW